MNQHDRPAATAAGPPFRLLLVTDRTAAPPGALVDAVDAAVHGGVDAVMLRDKDLPARERIALGLQLRAVTWGRALLLVNGPAVIARAVNADGLHLPDDPQAARPREWSGLLGYSAHTVDGLRRASALSAAYVLLGTIFPSRSHPGGPTGGLDLVRAAAHPGSGPALIAIGGITAENAGAVIEAGADGVAVISALLAAPDPEHAAGRLRAAVDAALLSRSPHGRHGRRRTAMIQITVNGRAHQEEAELPLPDLIQRLQISFPRIAVAHNGVVLRQEEHAGTVVRDGDSLEIVRMVGGGCE